MVGRMVVGMVVGMSSWLTRGAPPSGARRNPSPVRAKSTAADPSGGSPKTNGGHGAAHGPEVHPESGRVAPSLVSRGGCVG